MNTRIILLIGIYAGVILLFAWLRPEKLDWTPTYSTDKTDPFASRILYEELPVIRGEEISSTDRPLYNTLRENEAGPHDIYFLLNQEFQPGELDLEVLMSYVDSGMIVFLASGSFPDLLLDTLDLEAAYRYTGTENISRWYYEDNLTLALDTLPESSWRAATAGGYQSFVVLDSAICDTLGTIGEGEPVFMKCPFGKGSVFLHFSPIMFTNYHMLYRNNHEYISAVLGHVPAAERWIWDRYYVSNQHQRPRTPFAALAKYRSFRWAYWTGIAGIGLFILFTARRKQKVIPVLPQKRNTTLDFVRTIGDLYYHRADHDDLIARKIELLKNAILRNYRVTVSSFSAEEAHILASRSGIDLIIVEKLFARIRNLPASAKTQTDALWALQEDLDHFFQRKP